MVAKRKMDQQKVASFLSECQGSIDALLYIDTQLEDEDMQKRVQSMIKQEMTKFKPTEDRYLEHLPEYEPTFRENARLQKEFERVKKNIPMPSIDTTRYNIQNLSKAKQNDVDAWKKLIGNVQVQLEHQQTKMINLELMQKYGSKAWQARNGVLEETNNRLTREAEGFRKECEKINIERSQEQRLNVEQMQLLQHQWLETVQKNAEVEVACREIEAEIRKLQEQEQIVSK